MDVELIISRLLLTLHAGIFTNSHFMPSPQGWIHKLREILGVDDITT